MKKRALSLILALVMCLGLLPTMTLAADSNLPKLTDPTNLRWEENSYQGPGLMHWRIDGEFQGIFEIQVYKVGQAEPVYEVTSYGWNNEESVFDISYFIDDCAGNGETECDSGDYYFTVQSLGDGIEYSDSNVVSSQGLENGIYSYVKPEAKLAAPAQGAWNWPAAIWADDQEANDQIQSYCICYGFSDEKTDPNADPNVIETIGWSTGGRSGEPDEWLQDELIGKHGNGYYYFRIYPISSNIEQIRNGSFSPWSEGYNLREASLNIKNRLEEMERSSAEDILKAVQGMNTTELNNAMRADLENVQSGTIAALEALEKKAGGPAKVAVDAAVSGTFDADKISVVGASLNKERPSDPAVTLNVGRADPKDIRNELYNSTVAVNFSMDLENVKDSSDLDVPVKITMPVPAAINPDFLVVLHYHEDGSVDEVLTNRYQENGQWFVSFVLASFSDFVMTMTTDATTQPQSATANPTNDTLTVDGKVQAPTVYKIDGANYFKIRDLAAILNGTEKQFEVGYDGASKSVTATSGKSYTPAGGELAGAASSAQTATVSNDTIIVNGQQVQAQVYKIAGSNYFKLRDLGKALNFYVGYEKGKGMFIETDKPYSE